MTTDRERIEELEEEVRQLRETLLATTVELPANGLTPIDAEMTRLGIGIRRIPRMASFQGVRVNFREHPQVYDRFVVLAGNELKHPGFGDLGARDFLDAIVEGRHPLSEVYDLLSDGPDGGKASFIRARIAEYRGLAQIRILEEDPASLRRSRTPVRNRRQCWRHNERRDSHEDQRNGL